MDLRNMVIGILIGILLLLFTLIGITQCTDKNTIKDQSVEIESLKQEVLKYQIENDSIIQAHNKTIEGLQSLKHKINVTYQQTAEDFSDIVIVCDDDILKYIASQIQD